MYKRQGERMNVGKCESDRERNRKESSVRRESERENYRESGVGEQERKPTRERHRHPTNFTLASLSNDFRAI